MNTTFQTVSGRGGLSRASNSRIFIMSYQGCVYDDRNMIVRRTSLCNSYEAAYTLAEYLLNRYYPNSTIHTVGVV